MARVPPSMDRVFLVALGAYAVFLHPGVYLNDELAQVAGLHSLAEGGVLVDGNLPPGYDDLLRGTFRHWGVPLAGEPAVPPVGSPLLNLLALPVLALLSLLGAAWSAQGALSLSAGLLSYAGVREAWSMAKNNPCPRWVGVAVAAAFVPSVWAPPLPTAPYLELAALHLVSMAATAWAVALLHELLVRRAGPSAGLAGAVLFGLASPAFFWATGAKYHAVSVSLTAIALWLYQAGARTPPLRTAAAFAVAGLAVFNYLPMGGFVAITLALVAMPAIRLGVKGLAQRAGAALAGFSFGLIPEALHRIAVARAGSAQQFIVGVGNEATTHAPVAQQVLESTAGGLLRYSAVADWQAAAHSIAQTVVWKVEMTSPVMPMLVIAPWALLAAVAVARKELRERLGGPVWAFALIHLAVVLLVTGRALTGTRAGFDPRYASTTWPGLAVLAAATFAPMWDRSAARNLGWIAAAALGLALFGPVANMVVHAAGLTLTPQLNVYDQLLVPRLAGYACLFALAYALAWPRATPAWRVPAASLAAAIAVATQALLTLVFANTAGSAPFAAWPMELLSRTLRWMLFETGP